MFGNYAGEESRLTYVYGTVYFTGTYSGWNTSISNVFSVAGMAAHSLCFAQISNVMGNVYAIGYNSSCFANITDVSGNVVCGSNACEGAMLTNIGHVYLYGNNALNS